jgi:polyisoprenoid-binding protein YceI
VGKDASGKERMNFSGRTAVDRRSFGLQWSQALEAGGWLVGDRVDIELAVQVVSR